jgi:hypothetical protein
MDAERLALYRELQPFFERFKGELSYRDNFIPYLDSNGKITTIWFPDVYSRDPEHPERGLWGMVDWGGIYSHSGRYYGGELFIRFFCRHELIIENSSLDLALLCALKWQWERERKERKMYRIMTMTECSCQGHLTFKRDPFYYGLGIYEDVNGVRWHIEGIFGREFVQAVPYNDNNPYFSTRSYSCWNSMKWLPYTYSVEGELK